jgi:hypothetical protein
MKDDKTFQIEYQSGNDVQAVQVVHSSETYDFELNGKQTAIINNGDNSWSLASGDLDQLTVNLIGDAIEKFYKKQGW